MRPEMCVCKRIIGREVVSIYSTNHTSQVSEKHINTGEINVSLEKKYLSIYWSRSFD